MIHTQVVRQDVLETGLAGMAIQKWLLSLELSIRVPLLQYFLGFMSYKIQCGIDVGDRVSEEFGSEVPKGQSSE